MDPPADLTPEAREVWAVTVADLRDRGVLREAHRPAIEPYVRAVELARQAWAKAPKRRLTTRGDRGQMVRHPAIVLALQAEDAAFKFGQALQLDPASLRKRNPGGRPQGAESAPDRRDERPGLRVVDPSPPADRD